MFKVFKPNALSALLNAILNIKTDLTTLDGNVRTDLGTIVGAVNSKQAQVYTMTATLPASGWTRDGAGRFPLYLDVTAQNFTNSADKAKMQSITTADIADAEILTASQDTAYRCGFSPSVETMGGKVRVRAQKQPGAGIQVQFTITEGVTQ